MLPQYYENYAKEHGGEKAYADVIVVDPPRKGCDETLLETMIQMQPERIVYVSCDSATLARDLKYLCENGYELRESGRWICLRIRYTRDGSTFVQTQNQKTYRHRITY